MKRIIKGLFILICIIPIMISASTFKPSMSCPSTANPGDTVSCKITATIDSSITGVQGKFNLGGTSFVSFTKTKNLNYYVGDADGFSILEMDGIQAKIKSTSLTIGTLKVKIPNNNLTAFSIQVTDVAATNTNSDNIPADNLVQTIRIKSSDSSLKSLSVDGMTLGPNFSSTIYEYSLPETDKTSIKINAVANDSSSTIKGAGTVNLNYGDNKIVITVTSASGSSTKYTIKVHKTDTRDTVNTLSSLSVKGYNITPAFSANTKSYSLSVNKDVTKVEVYAILTSNKSSFTKGYGPRTVSLSYGNNEVIIKVKAENGKENTYKININREDPRDTNNFLSILSLSDGKLEFNKNTNNYTVNVSESLKEITISAVAESDKAKVTGSGTVSLNEGSNVVEITVKAENGSVRKYTITINRGESTINPDENNTVIDKKDWLKSVIINNATFEFNPEVYDYDIKLKEKDDKLDILFKPADGYEASLVGNDDLKNGSVVKLTVTDGIQEVEYRFNIVKDVVTDESKKSDLIFYIAAGSLGLVVFGILLAVLTRKNPTPEEVVKEKFVQETPRKYYNDPALVEGVSKDQVTGSIVRQVEIPNSLSDTPMKPEPIVIDESPSVDNSQVEEVVSFEEPVPIEEPSPFEEPGPIESNSEMSPMPINAPIMNEVAGDFNKEENVNLDVTSNTEPLEIMDFSEPKEKPLPDYPEFDPVTEEDKNNY